MAGLLFLGSILLLVIGAHIYEYVHRKQVLGDLTGNYYHKKSPKGNHLYVEVVLDKHKYFRKATEADRIKLKQIKYIL